MVTKSGRTASGWKVYRYTVEHLYSGHCQGMTFLAIIEGWPYSISEGFCPYTCSTMNGDIIGTKVKWPL